MLYLSHYTAIMIETSAVTILKRVKRKLQGMYDTVTVSHPVRGVCCMRPEYKFVCLVSPCQGNNFSITRPDKNVFYDPQCLPSYFTIVLSTLENSFNIIIVISTNNVACVIPSLQTRGSPRCGLIRKTSISILLK